VTTASQETVEPSCQRFVAESPQGTARDVGAALHVVLPPRVVMQDSDWGGGLWRLMLQKLRLTRLRVLLLLPLILMILMTMCLTKRLKMLGFLV